MTGFAWTTSEGEADLRAIFLSLLLFVGPLADAARADWMNLTGAETSPNIAEITVLDDHVHVALEIYIGDLDSFAELIPDDWLKAGEGDRPTEVERLRRFARETFQLVTETGERLPAQLELIEARLRKDRYSPFAGMVNPITRQRVPEAPADKRVAYAELVYPFVSRPKELTIIPPLDKDGRAVVTVGFIAYHKALPIIDFRYLSGPSKLRLDWEDPWYSQFENPNLKRHHKSPLMSFLYVEPREVRHEVLIRVRDLQDWTDLGLEGATTITVEEQAHVKDRARAFFSALDPLDVDGRPARPVSARAEFLNIALTGLQVVEEEKPLDLSTALVGVILSYPVKHLPNKVAVTWQLFSERITRIPATAIDPAGALPGFIDVDDPTLEWQNFLKEYQEPEVLPVVLDDGRRIGIPVMSLVLLVIVLGAAALAARPRVLSRRAWAGLSVLSAVAAVLTIRVAVFDARVPFAGPPDEGISAEIVAGVLNNVNRAFLEKEPDPLRRALGVVVANDKLADIGKELERALAIKVAGGGIARVNAIEDLSLTDITELADASGFRALAEWTARASAGHWGHAHRRTIRFRAVMEFAEVDGVWKLTGLTVVDATQQS